MPRAFVQNVVFALCLSMASVPARAANEPRPVLSFEPTGVIVSALRPGATIVLFSFARIPQETYSDLRRMDKLLRDEDGDGRIRFELPEGVPFKSIWAAIDYQTGAFSVATPPGFPRKEIEFPGNGLKRGVNGQLNKLENGRGYIELLWVRPELGAWRMSVSDGGAQDDDKTQNSRILISPSTSTPAVGKEAPPDHYKGGDVLVIIDTSEMEFFAVSVGAPR